MQASRKGEHDVPHAGWGEWSLADASRVLIREALKNPLNQRFIMLSESCVPLYPPAVVYQQLMWEKKSRINACDSDPNYYRDNYRCAFHEHIQRGPTAVARSAQPSSFKSFKPECRQIGSEHKQCKGYFSFRV